MCFIDPETGRLACDDIGVGKFAKPEDVVQKVIDVATHSADLKGRKVIITAGPTQEAIDPVRYITNHSSGKMGYAIAELL